MVCSGAVSAQFIAGKATRDALYLANLDVTTLPAMVIATAVFSILLVMASSRGLRTVSPATFVPVAFTVSAALLLGSWALTMVNPKLAAQLVYLQISGLGPMLGSSFWLIATERFDPHTARHHFSRIAAVSDAVVLDHFIQGDGSPDGGRTLRTSLPQAMRQGDVIECYRVEQIQRSL